MNSRTTPSDKRWTLQELANVLSGELRGDPTIIITGLATLKDASASEMSFLANPSYQSELCSTQAAAVILHVDQVPNCSVPCIVVDNPYLAYAKATHLFDTSPIPPQLIHATACVDSTAKIDATASIGAQAVIGADAVVHAGAIIGAGCVVGDNSVVGKGTRLHANVTLYHSVSVGDHSVVHSGVVIGGDGFGFANDKGQWQKIAQLGGVRIGNHVDIGANTTIDRGAIEDTRIHDNVILDNQIQIAHNVVIGEGTAIAGCTGIAGSTRIGKRCTIAGAVGIAGHLQICDDVHITMRSAITGSITEPGSYSSGTAMLKTKEWRKSAVRFRQLDAVVKKVNLLERFVKSLS